MLRRLKSYEQIIAPLADMTEDLDLLVERNNGVVSRNAQTIERLTQHSLQLNEESERSKATTQKIRDFFGV